MAQVRTVALCTTCGRSRTLAISGRPIGPEPVDAEARCMVDRYCRTCRLITAHAFLRPDEHRDELEGVLCTLAGAEDELRAEADAVAADLEALGVRVRRCDSERVLLLHLLASDTYAVVVGTGLSTIERAEGLRLAYQLLLADTVEWQTMPPDQDARREPYVWWAFRPQVVFVLPPDMV
jgi:hypothetical protein